jgi:hypothetical protein
MSDEQGKETDAPEEERRSTTSPPGGKTHEATTPPGQGDLDERAAEEAAEKLDQAGGGH